jgi:hypothetical protein
MSCWSFNKGSDDEGIVLKFLLSSGLYNAFDLVLFPTHIPLPFGDCIVLIFGPMLNSGLFELYQFVNVFCRLHTSHFFLPETSTPHLRMSASDHCQLVYINNHGFLLKYQHYPLSVISSFLC